MELLKPNDKILFMDRYTDDYQSYELESSYLAGVIDGDGSLSCSSKPIWDTFILDSNDVVSLQKAKQTSFAASSGPLICGPAITTFIEPEET